jgi:radical SAM superfamily enzyme YgiQ (UPF0313 family)
MRQGPSILLISLLGSTDNPSVKQLQAGLLRSGHDARILFCTTTKEADYRAVAAFVRSERIDIVGLSLMTPFLPKAIEITRAIREEAGSVEDPATAPRSGHGPLVIWGGIHPTIDPGSCFSHADYVCVGEADRGIVDFADAW